MKNILLILIIIFFGCSIVPLLPKACITIFVVDENEKPLQNISVGVGFTRNSGSGGTFEGNDGMTDNNGKFTVKGHTLNIVSYGASHIGYYRSNGEYAFDHETGGEWQPWNPEIKVVLRKIENPIPMYARHFEKVLPFKDKDIGCDLIANDWVKPYGTGTHNDSFSFGKGICKR